MIDLYHLQVTETGTPNKNHNHEQNRMIYMNVYQKQSVFLFFYFRQIMQIKKTFYGLVMTGLNR